MDAAFILLSRITAVAAFFLLFAGGMVTSTGSGLSVPDWPLSFGTLNPPMVGGVFYEHGHRLIAGGVAILVMSLAALARRPNVPEGARLASWVAAGAIVVQALLGGLTVLLRLPPVVSISHACLGQGVFCLILMASVLAAKTPPATHPRVFRLALLGFCAGYLQLALGAFVRHTGQGTAWHILWAFSVLILAALCAITAWRGGQSLLRAPAGVLLLVVLLQISLGLFALRVRVDASLTLDFRHAALWRTAHLAGGAVTLASFLILALKSRPWTTTA